MPHGRRKYSEYKPRDDQAYDALIRYVRKPPVKVKVRKPKRRRRRKRRDPDFVARSKAAFRYQQQGDPPFVARSKAGFKY